ncbi:glutathione S-transferase family protein [Oricola sp.]|uniref:glutathione S-transferase family protein n=1 Tax=Oricola sp. TaxID=1979950 RepID=UPI003BAC690E
MPKLLGAPASPFVAKVRMAATWLDLPVTIENVNVITVDEPPLLIDANPLGKIPTLILDDGYAVIESSAIMREFDRMSGKKLYPRNAEKLRDAERIEAMADGVSTCLQAQVYERRSRPEGMAHQPWIDKQARKAARGLDWLNEHAPRVTTRLHGGHFALAAMAGYLDLRFPDLDWRRGRPKLRRFEQRFEEAFPAYRAQRPHG